MEKKSLIIHICWVFVFLILCYGFGSIYTLLKSEFLVKRKLNYISIAMTAEPAMYLILGVMLGLLLLVCMSYNVSRRQMAIEMLIAEIPVLSTVLNELVRDLMVNHGFMVSRVINRSFTSVRWIAVPYILFLYISRRKFLHKTGR
ncbi:hypothetical protein [Anaerostipes sp.]|uniref:hypothetical protein n=1 Tax=Anaerostipes sp. TaxID=1872530 RepID=UPI0025BD631B|nr:hypothetical protein [Anaerostipes sp.]MBS7007001.1 hypothetical protein [Anaerostipes sp.]